MKGMYLIDDIAITEAGLRDAVQQYTKKGDSEMTKWNKVDRPPELKLITADRTGHVTILARGYMRLWSHSLGSSLGDDVRTEDLRGLIASLQSILVLAEEHFGEDWGK